jgi:transcriptional regulator with XRE-family HTH domain
MIGERIRKLRDEQGISQAELAKIMNVNRMTVNNYETGKRLPDIDFAINAATYFGVTVEYLSGRTEFRDKEDFIKTVEKVQYLVEIIELLPKEEGRQLTNAFTALLKVAGKSETYDNVVFAITNTFIQFAQILISYMDLKNNVKECVRLLKEKGIDDKLISESLHQKPHALYAQGMSSSHLITVVVSKFTTELIQEIKKELPDINK